MIRKDNWTMPEKESEYSLLIYALMIVIFLALAIIGSYVLVSIPLNVSGHGDGSANDGYYSSGGYGTEFFIDGTSRENQSGLQYARNGSFSGTLHYSASYDPPKKDSFLIMALVDYNLTSLYYNGSRETSHLIEYLSPVSLNVSFNLTGLPEGFHDLLFFTVQNPYNEPLHAAGLVFPQYAEGSGMLFNVIEGNDTRPDLQYGKGSLDKYVSYRNVTGNNHLGYGPWLTDKPLTDMMSPDGGRPSGEAIQEMKVAPGEDLDYYINVKNGIGSANERYGRFTLLQLLDYEQVPIRPDVSEYVYNGALSPGRFFAIHAGIKAPWTPGTHVLSLVMMTNPYENYNATGARSGFPSIVSVILNVTG
ncbi:MAG TPA: hypothetical protein VGJ92_01315 [Methanocella sp.]|jgi:hypothetical protein